MQTSTKQIIVISLTLNLITIGYFMGSLVNSLPVKKTQYQIKKKDFYDKSNQLKQEIIMILGNKDFDKAAFQAKVEELQRYRAESFQEISDYIIRIAENKSQSERQELAQNLNNLIQENKSSHNGGDIHHHYYPPPPHHGREHGRPPPPRHFD